MLLKSQSPTNLKNQKFNTFTSLLVDLKGLAYRWLDALHKIHHETSTNPSQR